MKLIIKTGRVLLPVIFLVLIVGTNKAISSQAGSLTVKDSKVENLKLELFGPSIVSLGGDSFIKDYLNKRSIILPKLKNMSAKELVSNIGKLPIWSGLKKGDVYSEEIINRGKQIIPELIEIALDDTTRSDIRIQDTYNYFIGDVAVLLIHELTKEDNLLEHFFVEEFNLNSGFSTNPTVFEYAYGTKLYETFAPEKSNRKNRYALYQYLKNHYPCE